MNKPRSMIKTNALVAIYKENINTPIKAAAKMTKCCSSYASDVKRWVKNGCIGPIKIRHTNQNPFRSRKKQGVDRELITVTCLGCDNKFKSESKYVRICRICAGNKMGMIESGMHDYAIL